jgi:NADPH-dependent 7-cyano-7-deazaguanine reductase QueF
VPREWIVESKLLELYVRSIHNFGVLHEGCTVRIVQLRRTAQRTHWGGS